MQPIIRTPKGTQSSKALGNTLSLAGVEMPRQSALIVGVIYETGQGAPLVKWGQRELSQIVTQTQTGIATALFILRHINNHRTRPVTCTWAGDITAKAMFVTGLEHVNIKDVSQNNGQTTTADPATGAVVQSTKPKTIQIAAFGSRGPESDDAGVVGSGHASGQRVGSTGAPPNSNVTIHETYEVLSAVGNVRATKTGATPRPWANVILAIKRSNRAHVGITISDLEACQGLFVTASLDWKNHAFRFNAETDEWEVYDVTDIGTRIGRMPAGDVLWE
jgi:hypothetical protein